MGSLVVIVVIDGGKWFDGGCGLSGAGWFVLFVMVMILRTIFVSYFTISFYSIGWDVLVVRVMVGFWMLVKNCL